MINYFRRGFSVDFIHFEGYSGAFETERQPVFIGIKKLRFRRVHKVPNVRLKCFDEKIIKTLIREIISGSWISGQFLRAICY